MKKYWYFIEIECCVLCGKEKLYKERRYTLRPDNPCDRRKFNEYVCPEHFI